MAKPLDCKFSSNEKQDVLTGINALLRQVKGFVDNNLNPAKVNDISNKRQFYSATEYQTNSESGRNFKG